MTTLGEDRTRRARSANREHGGGEGRQLAGGMRRVAEAQRIGTVHGAEFDPRGAGDGDDRPRLGEGEELPCLALQRELLAQEAPFQPVGILDEHREDAGAGAGQPRRREGGEAVAHGHRHLVLAAGAGGEDEDALAVAGDGEIGLGAEFVAQAVHQPVLAGLGGGEHQRVEPEDGGLVVIRTPGRGEHEVDPPVQFGEGLGAVGPRLAQAAGEGHFQQVAAGMRGEPGLQVGVDPVHQPHPGGAMHEAAGLGGERVAGDFHRRALARGQQVEARAVLEPGEGDLEPHRAVALGGIVQVKQRDQRAVILQRRGERGLEADAPGIVEPGGEGFERRDTGGENMVHRREGQVARDFLRGEFGGVAQGD
ncbi:hypothetical protein Acry_1321 [Acidiphilium cryptum JF-5]|uniref:Uncharacterized protein n=1 Tax=Acidiphilium cryptum (strain JF-5) TaxID=349163 RepID=A5FY50_ACICJ|nr:hypothetical protein Acry_1321 [Acidiphilium cryptum JF-5]